MSSWSHQTEALQKIQEVRDQGVRKLVVQGPTGCGKTRTFIELAKKEIENGGRVVIYTNRKTIRKQISDNLDAQGIYHGVRAAGYDSSLLARIQVSSIMTERVRSLGPESKWDIHDATLVIIDEAHSNRAKLARQLIAMHHSDGAFITGWSATPVGLGGIYTDMVHMASLKRLREAGVLVPCDVYAPEEVDMSGVKMTAGEFNQRASAARVRESIVIGQVIEHWERLNPDRKPTVLFAPGVPESKWFAEEFHAAGYNSAHVDARTSEEERAQIFEAWRDGRVDVVCNFGVLREGFDLQACAHAILCQPTNRISTYLQIAGRILRSSEAKTRAILQDHVGAYWRHGSPNADRTWTLNDTDSTIARERKKKQREEDPKEKVCPNCKLVRIPMPGFYGRCARCGYEHQGVYRQVRQTDGKLVVVDESSHRRKSDSPNHIMTRSIYAGVAKGMKASQVVAMATKRRGKWICQTECEVFIPYPGTKHWHDKAADVWPWAKKEE